MRSIAVVAALVIGAPSACCRVLRSSPRRPRRSRRSLPSSIRWPKRSANASITCATRSSTTCAARAIIVDELVAQYYESQQFQPAWQDPARLDELVASIDDLRNDGLDPNDYHVEALQSYRLDVRMQSPLTLQDRADLELLATDAFMLGLYHVYVGKVDPVKLSSQWNFSQRPTPSFEEGLQRFSARLAAGEIREAFERARPSHAWYQRGRERLQEYRAIAAAGGWPPFRTAQR